MISTRRNSNTVLAFCGSPTLGQFINEHKISNDMVKAVTGNKKHQMDFVCESYGGVLQQKKKGPNDKKVPYQTKTCNDTHTSRETKPYLVDEGEEAPEIHC